jgi:hypothetical protein
MVEKNYVRVRKAKLVGPFALTGRSDDFSRAYSHCVFREGPDYFPGTTVTNDVGEW